MRFVAYYRVSSPRQGVSGLGVDAQKAAVKEYIDRDRRRNRLVAEFVEVKSGRSHKNRPMLQRALAECRVRRATLIVAKLDRLGRNSLFIHSLLDSKVGFVPCDFPESGNTILQMLAVLAEFESRAATDRMSAIWAVRKENPKTFAKWRSPRWRKAEVKNGEHLATVYQEGAEASAKVRSELAKKRAEDLRPVIEGLRRKGVVRLRHIADALNADGYQAPRGGQWHATSVARLLA